MSGHEAPNLKHRVHTLYTRPRASDTSLIDQRSWHEKLKILMIKKLEP